MAKQKRITVGTIYRRRWLTWLGARTRQPMTNGLVLLAHRSVRQKLNRVN